MMPADFTFARVSEVFQFNVLYIVFIIWYKVGSTSKVSTVHLPFKPPNPSVRAHHQHQPLCIQEEHFWLLCSCTRESKRRLMAYICIYTDHFVVFFEDHTMVQ